MPFASFYVALPRLNSQKTSKSSGKFLKIISKSTFAIISYVFFLMQLKFD